MTNRTYAAIAAALALLAVVLFTQCEGPNKTESPSYLPQR